jgi:hypothetical protein
LLQNSNALNKVAGTYLAPSVSEEKRRKSSKLHLRSLVNHACIVVIFTKLTIFERMCVEVFCTELYPNRSRNRGSAAGNSFTPLEAYGSRQAGFQQTHSSSKFIRDFYAEFHENLTKSLVADTNLLTHRQIWSTFKALSFAKKGG